MKVSVIIPCKNEEQYIEKCIESVLKNNYKDIKVIVCDGKSTDNTQDIVRRLEAIHPQVKLLINERETTPFALNLGIKSINSDVYLILGAHAELALDHIENAVQLLNKKYEVGCVGGILENVYSDDTSEAIGMAMSSRFGVGDAKFRTGAKDGYVDTVAFGAYRKEVFEKIGYFDDELTRNQDDEFNYRLTQSGFKIYFSNSIRSKYYVRGSFEKLFKQYYQYGYWKVLVNKKHNTITTIRQLIPLFFVLFLIFGGGLAFLSKFVMSTFVIVLLLYFLLGGFSAVNQAKGILKTGKVLLAFFILHISYGIGYLIGLFDFFILNKNSTQKAQSTSR